MKTTFLKWMVVVAGAGLATAVIHPRLARSADHLDAPNQMDPAADINDVYTFLDGANAVFAMTVYPAASDTAKFSDAVQYVMHTTSGASFGMAGNDYNIICTFDAAQAISCWAGTDEYVTGNPSAAAGLSSKSGKLKVFAGRRGDPFFFNLAGFRNTDKFVTDNAGALTFDDAGCPNTGAPGTGIGSTVLQPKLKGDPDGGTGAAVDFFEKLNTLAIVVSIDKSLVTKGGQYVSVWASTHKKP